MKKITTLLLVMCFCTLALCGCKNNITRKEIKSLSYTRANSTSSQTIYSYQLYSFENIDVSMLKKTDEATPTSSGVYLTSEKLTDWDDGKVGLWSNHADTSSPVDSLGHYDSHGVVVEKTALKHIKNFPIELQETTNSFIITFYNIGNNGKWSATFNDKEQVDEIFKKCKKSIEVSKNLVQIEYYTY